MTDVVIIENNLTSTIENEIVNVNLDSQVLTDVSVENNVNIISVDTNPLQIIIDNEDKNVVIENEIVKVLTVGIQGPEGPQGPVGPEGGVEGVAGEILSALRIVYTDPISNKLFYADKDIPNTVKSLLGVTRQAGAINTQINVVTFGEMVDFNWNWDMNLNVSLFLGNDGAITQGVTSGSIIARIGHAVSPTSIFIRMGEPVLTI